MSQIIIVLNNIFSFANSTIHGTVRDGFYTPHVKYTTLQRSSEYIKKSKSKCLYVNLDLDLSL